MTLHDKVHHFGGDWTEAKLNVIAKYLTAYRRALKNQPFRVAYIDAFAGTGYIAQKEDLTSSSGPLFPDLATQEPQGLLEGSARRALRTNPPFDKYLFIDTTIPSLSLFSNEQERIKANMEVIGRYFNGRLKSIFAGVAQKPGILRNSTNNPLYLLCFATGNPNGAPIAVRIAEHLLKDLQ